MTDVTWAQKEAKRIVREGMKDVFEWLFGPEYSILTPEQFVRYWDTLDADDRLVLARKVLGALEKASECFMMDHEGQRYHVEQLTRQVVELQIENARLRTLRVEIVDAEEQPKACRVWRDGVLIFDGVGGASSRW